MTLVKEFQLHFDLTEFDDPSGHIVENIKVDWANYKTEKFDDKEWYEFQVIEERPVAYSGEGRIQGQYFTLLAHKTDEGFKFFVNKMLSYSDGEGFTYFNIKEKYYHGMAYLYNLEGEVEHLFHFEKGKLMRSVESIKTDISETETLGLIARGECHEKASTARCNSALECALNGGPNGNGTGGNGCGGGGGPGGSGGGFRMVTTHHYTDWYNDRGSYSEYSHTEYNGSTSEWVWVGGSSGYSGQGYSDSSYNYASTSPEGYSSGQVDYSITPPANAEEEPNKLILNLNDMLEYPCVADIIKELSKGDFKNLRINDLGNLEMGRHLSSAILGIFENSANYDIHIRVDQLGYGPNGNEINGETVSVAGGWQITIDKDLAKNGTSLSVAKTMIHESVHAYIYYVLKTQRKSDLVQDIVALFNKFRNEGHSGIAADNLSQHEFMTQLVDAMAYSLSVWDSHKLPMEYYKNITWGGLETSEAYKKLENKNEIQKNIKSERYGYSSALGEKCD
ncbi:hypothetical protein [Flagellimonas lutaonensis]|uniref:Uncharacterized protein n=1 Tax=Flagellimonas lutaonensis TaxID=516051 RepID=A0A0D5YXE4_9FLAO|nr:hypothetical protein [Allomuricauda lutaonensis]AKA36539.1 hypothetical protein VC82_2995 [Allomuricauda lutaonensis]